MATYSVADRYAVDPTRFCKHVDVTIGTYATGGVSLAPSDVGLSRIVSVVAPPASGYTFAYDYTNAKLKVFQGDNANAAAAPAVEVPNAANLAAVTTRATIVGM